MSTLSHINTNNLQFSKRKIVGYYESVVEDGLYNFEKSFLQKIGFDSFENLNILNLGCGAGREAIWFSRHGALVTALDCSEAMLKSARKNAIANKTTIDFLHSNCFDFISEKKFDLIFGTHNFISHVVGKENRICLLRHLRSYMDNNAVIVLSFHNRFDPHSKHLDYWRSAEELQGPKRFYNGYELELGDIFIPVISNFDAELLFHFFSLREIEHEAQAADLTAMEMIPIYELATNFKWSNSVWLTCLTK